MLRPLTRLPGALNAGHRASRLVAVLLVLQLSAAVGAAALVEPPAPLAPRASTTQARVAPPVAAEHPESLQSREARLAAVEQLLADRAGALLRRDQAAFLAVLDPAATALRDRQSKLFEALEQVPLSVWRYRVDAATQRPSDREMDRRYGRDRWWAPDVTLEYSLAGFDDRPTASIHYLTFVQRDGRWLIGADDDFAAVGLETTRALWDRGPVVAERVDDVLVLGRPAARRLLRNVAALGAAAVPRVSDVWGSSWRQGVVVLVPSSAKEMQELLGSTDDLSQIAAVATAELAGGSGGFDPSSDRVLVNPDTFGRLGQLGRQVVLTHEVTHVATRRATGPAMPVWLAEGLADYIGYQAVDLPLALSARELRKDVRAGTVPTTLPADEDFSGANAKLAQAYEQSWLAVRLLADRYGEDAMLRVYRAVGAARDVEPTAAVDQALRAEVGLTLTAFTEDWQDSLRRDLR